MPRTPDRVGSPPRGSRSLRFFVGDVEYALPVDAVARLSPVPPLQQVPLAPAPILGVCASQGRPTVVIDLSRMFGHEPRGDATLVVLAPPYEHTALLVHGPLRLPEPGGEEQACARLFDPAMLADLSPFGSGSVILAEEDGPP